MTKILGALGVFCAGAIVGILVFRMVAIKGEWVYTDYDYNQALKEQRITYYSSLCDALGETQWLEAGKSLDSLRRAENAGMRIQFSNQMTKDMNIEDALENLVTSRCANLLATS
ncbi:MAG: hypothetical protein WD075_05265 [Rhodospirillales bacterium]